MKNLGMLLVLAFAAGCETNNYYTINTVTSLHDAGSADTTTTTPQLAPDASVPDATVSTDTLERDAMVQTPDTQLPQADAGTTSQDTAPDADSSKELAITFTTAFHAAESFKVRPGSKSVIFGTYLFQNKTGSDIAVNGVDLRFLCTDEPTKVGVVYSPTGMCGNAKISDHLRNCYLQSWPELRVYTGLANPGLQVQPLFRDRFTVRARDTLALDVRCDFTDAPPSFTDNSTSNGFAVTFFRPEDIFASDPFFKNIPTRIIEDNGNPPKLAVILIP